jgi:hypothetical protein
MRGGTATIIDSILVDNHGGEAGTSGLAHGGGVLIIINNRMAHNQVIPAATAVGGISQNSGMTRILNSTIVENIRSQPGHPAGLQVISGTVELQNTILAHNADPSGRAHDCGGRWPWSVRVPQQEGVI